jgi:hypothetical protein
MSPLIEDPTEPDHGLSIRIHRGHMAYKCRENITANTSALLDYSDEWCREVGFLSVTSELPVMS